MTGSPRVVVRGEAIAEVLPDAAELVVTTEVRDRRRERAVQLLADRQQALTALLDRHRDALGTVSTDAVSVFPESPDGVRGGGPVAVASTLAAAAPRLDLQPAPQQLRGSVEVTFTMSAPDEEVFGR